MFKLKVKDYLLIGLCFSVFAGYLALRHINGERKENWNLAVALTDSLKTYRLKDSSHVAKITTLKTLKTKDFLKLKSKDKEIISLQNKVREYKKSIKKSGSLVSTFKAKTSIAVKTKTEIESSDSIKGKDSLVYIYPTYKSELSLGKWVSGTAIASKDSTILTFNIHDEYDVVNGYEGKWYQKKKPFSLVRTYNPYNTIKTHRTYQVSGVRPKKLGIGVHVGYGGTIVDGIIKTGLQGGAGINWNLIEF